MSTADVTHIQQGFRVPIPHVDEEARVEVPVVTLCERYLKFGKPFKKVCGNVQKARDMSKDMYELANRADEAMEMITTVTTHLAEMKEYIKKRHNWVIEVVNYLELTDKALQLFDLLMTMMLEDRMGAVVYMDKSYAFRRGVQALLQGKLTIDLVPPTLIKTAVKEVTAYLKRGTPTVHRWHLRVRHSIMTTANHCSSRRMKRWWCSYVCL